MKREKNQDRRGSQQMNLSRTVSAVKTGLGSEDSEWEGLRTAAMWGWEWRAHWLANSHRSCDLLPRRQLFWKLPIVTMDLVCMRKTSYCFTKTNKNWDSWCAESFVQFWENFGWVSSNLLLLSLPLAFPERHKVSRLLSGERVLHSVSIDAPQPEEAPWAPVGYFFTVHICCCCLFILWGCQNKRSRLTSLRQENSLTLLRARSQDSKKYPTLLKILEEKPFSASF